MTKSIRKAILQLCASLVLLAPLPASTSASTLPSGLSGGGVFIIVPPGQLPAVSAKGQGKSLTARIGAFRERLRALRVWRGMLRTAVDEGKADRLAKRSLIFGIIAMSTLLFAWLPVAGGILVLGSVPMGVLAIVDGLKAGKMGSERTTGLVLGIVAVSLFLLAMIIALLFVVGYLTLLG
ncbi:MAG: hypothetical protein EBZ67_03165 [Chitinophagia bacterium]|nr:hypothetical protein [Chitinophagia bacterium]